MVISFDFNGCEKCSLRDFEVTDSKTLERHWESEDGGNNGSCQ